MNEDVQGMDSIDAVRTAGETDRERLNPPLPFSPYWYLCREVVKVYDGDTFTLRLTLGFEITFTVQVRLLGIDTPEIRGDERERGLEVRDYVRLMLENAQEIIVNTYKDRTGKYGRYLAIVYVDGLNLNLHLLDEGLAEPY